MRRATCRISSNPECECPTNYASPSGLNMCMKSQLEIHRLIHDPRPPRDSLQFLRSHFRWGLTGTPPIDTNAGGSGGSEGSASASGEPGAIFMSSLFRVDLPGYIEAPHAPK